MYGGRQEEGMRVHIPRRKVGDKGNHKTKIAVIKLLSLHLQVEACTQKYKLECCRDGSRISEWEDTG